MMKTIALYPPLYKGDEKVIFQAIFNGNFHPPYMCITIEKDGQCKTISENIEADYDRALNIILIKWNEYRDSGYTMYNVDLNMWKQHFDNKIEKGYDTYHINHDIFKQCR